MGFPPIPERVRKLRNQGSVNRGFAVRDCWVSRVKIKTSGKKEVKKNGK